MKPVIVGSVASESRTRSVISLELMIIMDKSCCFLLLTFAIVVSSQTDNSSSLFFRKDYQLDNDLGKFYKFHNNLLNFSEAVATCKAEGAELFTPASSNDTETIYRLLNNSETVLWIGIHDLYTEGSFVNLKGEREIYTNWRAGEPNNQNDEDCVAIYKDTSFNDYSCRNRYRFVCSRSTENLTRNEACDTYDLDYMYNATLNKCYKLHKEPLTWSEAYRTCVAEEASMVIINSELEAQYMVDQFEMYPESTLRGNFDKGVFLLGFSDLINQGTFITVEGKTLSESGYDDWGPGQPDNYNEEHCGSMFRTGKLNDVGCNIRAMFFCEREITTLSLDARFPVMKLN